MDLHGLKRKKLQELCKKHGIPANLKTLEMTDRLSSILKEENPRKRGRSCLKNLSVVLENKKPKRVKFSPQNETFIFEKTDPREMRLLARKKRAFGKSKMEENPVVSIGGIVDDLDNENVDNLEKPFERILRKRSSVVEKVENPSNRTSRRKSVVPDPIAMVEVETGVVDKVDQPVKRVLKQKPVVAKPSGVTDTESVNKVEKPVGRILTRASVVKANVNFGSKVVGNVEKPVPRISRRKIALAEPDAIVDSDIAVEMDKPILRNSRRKCVVAKRTEVLDTEIVDKVDKPVKRIMTRSVGNKSNATEMAKSVDVLEKPARRGKKDRVEDVLISPCATNKAKHSRKGEESVGRLAVEEVIKSPDELVGLVGDNNMVKRRLRSMGLTAEMSGNGDDGVMTDRGQPRRSVREVKNANALGDTLVSKVHKSEEVSDQAIVEKNSQENTPDMAADIKEGKGGRKIIAPKLQECKGGPTDHVLEKENMAGGSTPAPSLLESWELNINDQCHAKVYSNFLLSKAESSMEVANFSPNNSSEKPFIPRPECQEETDIIDDPPDNEVVALEIPVKNESLKFQNSGDGVAENFMQANKGEGGQETSLHQNIVADNITDEGPASAPLSLLKRNISGTLSGSKEETTCGGEPTCISALKPSKLGISEEHDAGEEQPSSSLSELRDSRVFGSSEGLECDNQIRNEELVKQDNGFEEFPCLNISTKIENAAEEQNIHCVAVTFETLEVVENAAEEQNVQATKQEGSAGSKGSRDFISEEDVVVNPVASTGIDHQPPIVVDRVTLPSNATPGIINKAMEEAKNRKSVTPLANRTDSSGSDAKKSCLVSLNKDDGDDRKEPSSVKTFLPYLESQVNDAMRILSDSLKEGEECSQVSLRGDIAYAANNIKVKSLAERDSPVIVEQLHETNNTLDGDGDDMINSSESKEMKYEKATMAKEKDASVSCDGGEAPVLFEERKWVQEAGKGNISPDLFLDMVDDVKSLSSNDRAYHVNFKDREAFDASHPEIVVSPLDVGNICIEVSEPIPAVDTIAAENDKKVHMKDDYSSDWYTIPQKETLHPLENLHSNFAAPSCSMVEENQQGTLSRDSTCSATDTNLKYAAESHKCITVMQREEAPCSNESKFERLVSEDDISKLAQSKDQQFEMVTCPTEEQTFFDNLAAQSYSVAKEVKSLASETGHLEKAEGASTCGKESVESTTCNELVEVLGKEFDWKTTSVGSIEKELKSDPQQVRSVEGAKKGANSDEKESSKSSSDADFGEAVESGLGSQSSLLITMPDEGKSDRESQTVEVRLLEDIDPGHIAGNGNYTNSCVGHLEMAERSDSLKTNNITGRIVIASPFVDRGPCYSANFHGETCENASDFLQTSQEKKCHKTRQNASTDYIEGLRSGEPMFFEDDKDNKGEKMQNGVENSDALPAESSIPDDIIPQACLSKLDGGSESISRENVMEFCCTTEKELQDLISNPLSVSNSKKDDTKGNCDNVFSPLMVETLSLGENGKEARETEGALYYVSEEQIHNHMNDGNRTGQKSACEGKIGGDMNAIEEDNYVKGTDTLPSSRSENIDFLPWIIGDISDVATYIAHEKSINSDADLEFNANEGNFTLGQKISNEEPLDGNINPLEKESWMAEYDSPALEGSDNVESSPCAVYPTNSIPEHIVYRESRSPVLSVVLASYKDDTQELDSAKNPDFRDAQYDKEKQARILSMINTSSSESLIANHNSLGSNRIHRSIDVSGVHEMGREALSDVPFTQLEQENDDGNSESNSENGSDDVIHGGKSSDHDRIAEEITYPHSTEEHEEVAKEDFTRPNRQTARDIDACDASASASAGAAEVDFLSPYVTEYFSGQLQQPNYTTLMPSYQQMDPTESACQSDKKDMKSYIESFLITDSEIDLFWREMEKDELRMSQTEASNVEFSVNEYEIANDSERLERVDDVVGQVGNCRNCINVEKNDNPCPIDANNLGKVAEKKGDLDSNDKVLMSSLIQRNILIHETPKEPTLFVREMKENPTAQKSVLDATAVKPNNAIAK